MVEGLDDDCPGVLSEVKSHRLGEDAFARAAEGVDVAVASVSCRLRVSAADVNCDSRWWREDHLVDAVAKLGWKPPKM